jgi:hypothetical protein
MNDGVPNPVASGSSLAEIDDCDGRTRHRQRQQPRNRAAALAKRRTGGAIAVDDYGPRLGGQSSELGVIGRDSNVGGHIGADDLDPALT